MAYTQDNRQSSISTPLGKDVLLLKGFTGREGISQLFRFDLELLSEVNPAIEFKDVIGKNVTMAIKHQGTVRYINGFVSRFGQGEGTPTFAVYRAEVVPWLWFLTQTADVRIFQNMTVPDILQKVFKDLGFTDFKLNLTGTYPPREYCVQYRETDFAFVSRLMEQYGIFYFFEHANGKHTLILGDSPGAYVACEPSGVRYQADVGGVVTPDDVVTRFTKQQEFRPGKWAMTDYNFETPSTKLDVNAPGVLPGADPKFEVYDYPGEYQKRAEGDALVRIRMEEEECQRDLLSGASQCAQFTGGCTMTIKGNARADFDGTYMLTSVEHAASEHAYDSSSDDDNLAYSNTFTCIPGAIPFRPKRVTPKPVVQGSQTAEVVGVKGEEIYTDKHGRVKVQFYWDREGKKDENSSCWIRVSQPWAGKGWGSVSIPRIGQEVIVDFLEGDPDQPIITGRVYNGEQTPPYPLPAGGVVSGGKSNSTKGGGGFNELSMDDTKGKEKITIHGQYDLNSLIEHDQSWTVKNDKTTTVDGTHTETIKKDTTITISEGALTQTVAAGTATYKVKGAVDETFEATQTTTVTNEVVIKSVNAHVHVSGGEEIKLSSGTAFILIKNTGEIEIQGTKVKMVGTDESKIAVGSQSVVCNKQKVETAAAGITTSASGIHEIVGTLIKIN
jgi:type VI secretion system secreted protein VgrG